MAHNNAITLTMSVEEQENELYKRVSKLLNRIERILTDASVGFDYRKMSLINKKAKRGEYNMYDPSDKRKQVRQTNWVQFQTDVCVAILGNEDIASLPAKVNAEFAFEYEKQTSERVEILRKDKQNSLQIRNGLPMVSGKWRKEPYSARQYENITDYVPFSIPDAPNTDDSIENNATLRDTKEKEKQAEIMENEQRLLGQLDTSLACSYLGQPYNYDDGELTEEWMTSFKDTIDTDVSCSKSGFSGGKGTPSRKKMPKTSKTNDPVVHHVFRPSEDDVIRLQLENLLEVMKIQIQDKVCTDNNVLKVEPIGLGPRLKEVLVWGIDCHTRRMIEIAVEDHSELYQNIQKYAKDQADKDGECASMHTKGMHVETLVYFIESIVLPAINAQSAMNAHNMKLAAQSIVNTFNTDNHDVTKEISTSSHDSSAILNRKFPPFALSYAHALLSGIDEYGLDFFRIHPKGTGVICTDPAGIPPHVVISPYLGELYPPFRWCERMDVVEQAQKKFHLKPTLPDFYNILLERPRQDKRGYGLLYVDASMKANMGSSCSHSCNANCSSNIVSRNGKLGIVLTTNRSVHFGEELCMDYFSVTTSEVEWRASICLCGMKYCRGTFLHYATEDDLQQVLTQNCGVLWRYATLLRSCSYLPVSREDRKFLHTHGMGETVFGFDINVEESENGTTENEESEDVTDRSRENAESDWILKYASDNLRFVEYERKALPMALMRSNSNRRAANVSVAQNTDGIVDTVANSAAANAYTFTEADMEARSVMEQRVQSFVSCYSMLRRVITSQSEASPRFPLRPLLVEQAIERVMNIVITIPLLLHKYVVQYFEGALTARTNSGDNCTGLEAKKRKLSGGGGSGSISTGLPSVMYPGTDCKLAIKETCQVIEKINALLYIDDEPASETGVGSPTAAADSNGVHFTANCEFPGSPVNMKNVHTPDSPTLKKSPINSPRAKRTTKKVVFHPRGFTSLRKLLLQIRSLIQTVEQYSTTEARLALLCDILVLWANTSNYSMVSAFEPIDSDPVSVVARELGTNISRNKLLQVINNCGGNVDGSASDRLALKRVASTTVPGVQKAEKDRQEQAESQFSIDLSKQQYAELSDPSKPAIMDPNELVFMGRKRYDPYFIFCLLMQWFNAGTDDKINEPDLFGCVQLPLPGACFGASGGSSIHDTGHGINGGPNSGTNTATKDSKDVVYNNSSPLRKTLLNLIRNERSQINPWPNALKNCFNGLYGYVEDLPSDYARALDTECLREKDTSCVRKTAKSMNLYKCAILGSPLLDVSLGQVDAMMRLQEDLQGVVEKVAAEKNTKNSKSKIKTASVNEDNSQFDNVLPPEMPTKWVQCENCKKWRRIAWYVDNTKLPDLWTCSMNTWDPEKATCDQEKDWFDAETENTVDVCSAGNEGSADILNNIESFTPSSMWDVWCTRNCIYYEGSVVAVKKPGDYIVGKGKKKGTAVTVPMIKFHFLGWGSRFDEWIPLGSDRIHKHNLFTMSRDFAGCGSGNAVSVTKLQQQWQGQCGVISAEARNIKIKSEKSTKTKSQKIDSKTDKVNTKINKKENNRSVVKKRKGSKIDENPPMEKKKPKPNTSDPVNKKNINMKVEKENNVMFAENVDVTASVSESAVATDEINDSYPGPNPDCLPIALPIVPTGEPMIECNAELDME